MRSSNRDRPGRDSGSSYPRREERSDSGGRDRSRPAFKPRDDARSSFRDRPTRDFGSSSSSRGARDGFKPQGRLERSRSKESGFAGQPGFSFDKEPGSEFASHGRRSDSGMRDSGRRSFDSPRRESRDDGPPRDQGDRGDRKSFSDRGDRKSFSEPSDRDGFRPYSRQNRSRSSESSHERGPAFSERRQSNNFASKDRDEYPSARRRTDRPETARRERSDATPAQKYSPAVEEDIETPESEQADRPRKGLLRDIKSACKLIKSIQVAEATGEDTSEMVNMTNAVLRSVNVHVASGNFEDDPSEAVASLFQKKASEGTFYVDADSASGGRSILFQRGDGKIGFAAKRHDVDEDVRPARNENRSERTSRTEDRSNRATSGRDTRGSAQDPPEDDGIPISIPFTTAASEFLYGSNAVLAALRGKRRKCHHLYIHPKIFERESGISSDQKASRYAKPAHEFIALAKESHIPFRNEFRTHLLDKMSDNRPHNGVVLEVSKLPAPPLLSLGTPDARKSLVPLVLAPQSAEDVAVNGNPETLSVSPKSWRNPFIVMLDGILDPGNVGNILRTCHFYNVDAVVVATNTCANLSSAVLAKASSGACEAVRIFALPQPSNFVYESAKKGWRVYAAVAPTVIPPPTGGRSQGKDKDAKPQLTTAEIATKSPLAESPCILMLGAEGEGLRENLKNRANAFVSIDRGQNLNVEDEKVVDVGVDSMNVSVAAGVLLESFLRKPEGAAEVRDSTGELGF